MNITQQPFVPFPKLSRLSREAVITEKIDGTNASIFIDDDRTTVLIGSRSRWITPEDDNFGFARWCMANREELLTLGPGHHFGEWWGSGIQRNYGLTEKRFSLFNTGRWVKSSPVGKQEIAPACCHVVPVLWTGLFSTGFVDGVLLLLKANGSTAAPGFMKPEGVVVYHTAAGVSFKKTIEGDGVPKSLQ